MDNNNYSLEELMILLEASLVKDFNDSPLPLSIKAPILEKVAASFNSEKDKVMQQAYNKLDTMMKQKQSEMEKSSEDNTDNEEGTVTAVPADEPVTIVAAEEDPRQ